MYMVVVTGSVTYLLLVSQEACGPSAANGATCITHTHSGKRLATAVMRRNYNYFVLPEISCGTLKISTVYF